MTTRRYILAVLAVTLLLSMTTVWSAGPYDGVSVSVGKLAVGGYESTSWSERGFCVWWGDRIVWGIDLTR